MMSVTKMLSNRHKLMCQIYKLNDRPMPEDARKHAIEDIIMTHAQDLFSKGYIPPPDRSMISIIITGSDVSVDNKYTADIFNFEHSREISL